MPACDVTPEPCRASVASPSFGIGQRDEAECISGSDVSTGASSSPGCLSTEARDGTPQSSVPTAVQSAGPRTHSHHHHHEDEVEEERARNVLRCFVTIRERHGAITATDKSELSHPEIPCDCKCKEPETARRALDLEKPKSVKGAFDADELAKVSSAERRVAEALQRAEAAERQAAAAAAELEAMMQLHSAVDAERLECEQKHKRELTAERLECEQKHKCELTAERLELERKSQEELEAVREEMSRKSHEAVAAARAELNKIREEELSKLRSELSQKAKEIEDAEQDRASLAYQAQLIAQQRADEAQANAARIQAELRRAQEQAQNEASVAIQARHAADEQLHQARKDLEQAAQRHQDLTKELQRVKQQSLQPLVIKDCNTKCLSKQGDPGSGPPSNRANGGLLSSWLGCCSVERELPPQSGHEAAPPIG